MGNFYFFIFSGAIAGNTCSITKKKEYGCGFIFSKNIKECFYQIKHAHLNIIGSFFPGPNVFSTLVIG